MTGFSVAYNKMNTKLKSQYPMLYVHLYFHLDFQLYLNFYQYPSNSLYNLVSSGNSHSRKTSVCCIENLHMFTIFSSDLVGCGHKGAMVCLYDHHPRIFIMNKEKTFFEDHSMGEFRYNSSYFEDIYQKIIVHSLDAYRRYSIIHAENVTYLKDKLGKQDFCTSDSANRRLYVWKRSLPSGIYWIITGGNGRGTSYEVDATVNLNEVMSDILDVYDITDLQSIVEPFSITRHEDTVDTQRPSEKFINM